VSRATVARHLSARGLVTPEPKKRPKSSYLRFEASMPNETWQSDPQPIGPVRGEGPADQVRARVRPGPGHGRAGALRAGDPTQAKVFHQPLGGAPRHRPAAGQDVFAVQLRVHLPDPVDP
jgi:hypothetical protein